MNRQSAWVRTLLASVALASAVALSGCDTDGTSPLVTARAMAPLSSEMVSLLEQKNMPKESPILVRIFKEEAELEIWKQDAAGRYALLKTYPICRWSGELGPKVKEGDRQAPEGFYTITPAQMNPNSNYYLSFNIGFPNAFDRANDRTGAFLMVHGDCSSAGCYAMTDEQMGEIYALGREAFFGGQKSFQIQAYPFHMTPLNMARHRNSPNMAFWRMIKEGNDHFEVTRQEPKVDVCEKRYVFDANPSSRLDPRGRCPNLQVPEETANAVAEKKARDDREFTALVARNTPTVAVRTGADGGMNKLFLAKLRQQDRVDESGRVFSLASTAHVPDMGHNVNPPKITGDSDTTTASVPPPAAPAPAAPQAARVASADGGSSTNMFGGLSKWFGGGNDAPPPQPAPAPAPTTKPKADAKPRPAVHHAPRPQVAEKPATAAPAPVATASPAPVAAAAPAPATAPAPAQAAAPNLIAGAQPVVSSGSFDSRWGGLR